MRHRSVVAVVLALAVADAAASCCSTDAPDGTAPPALSAPSFGALSPTVAVSGQPSGADLTAARAAGYVAVVNFRVPGESGEMEDEAAFVESLGMRYASIPVAGSDLSGGQAERLRAVLDEAGDAPVLLHCASGRRARLAWDALQQR